MSRERLIIRAVASSIENLWEIGDEADGAFVPWVASTSEAVLRMFVARECARTPNLIVEDRRRLAVGSATA